MTNEELIIYLLVTAFFCIILLVLCVLRQYGQIKTIKKDIEFNKQAIYNIGEVTKEIIERQELGLSLAEKLELRKILKIRG